MISYFPDNPNVVVFLTIIGNNNIKHKMNFSSVNKNNYVVDLFNIKETWVVHS